MDRLSVFSWPSFEQVVEDAATLTMLRRANGGGRVYREHAIRRSKYMPHQGKRERDRARRNYERLAARKSA